MSRSSYTSVKRCLNGTTSDCIEWVGEAVPCLDVCKGDTLTELENAVLTKLCELVDLTDASNITIPTCFTDAWATRDRTILEFLQFLLTQACEQKQATESINDELVRLDPLIEVDYKCCSDNPCVTIGEVKLSVALQNILNCLCDVKSLIGVLPDGQTSVVGYIQNLEARVELQTAIINHITDQYTAISASLATISAKLNTHKDSINCIIQDLDDTGNNPNSCTPIS